MKVIFLPVAKQELEHTIEFYETQLSGLGVLFRDEVFEAIDFFSIYSEGHQLITKITRKCPLRKFPYLILYGITGDAIIISAIAHQHRNPNTYMHRKN